MSNEPITLRGTVTKLFAQNARFCAGRLHPEAELSPLDDYVREDYDGTPFVTFAGKAYVREGELVALRGRWVDHETYGPQFQVSERLAEGAVTASGMANWLAVNGRIHGIGEARAKRIAAKFAGDLGDVLRSEPERIADECDVPLDVVQALAKTWAETEQLNEAGTRLAAFGLTQHQIEALYEKFKGGVIALLEDDPYLLLGEVPGLGYKKVDAIALKMGVEPTHKGRVTAAITFALAEQQMEGSTAVEETLLIDSAKDLLSGCREADDLIEERLLGMIDARPPRVRQEMENLPGIAVPRSHLSLPGIYRRERQVYDFLRSFDRPSPQLDPRNSEEFVRRNCGHLDETQRAATFLALTRRGCLVVGGAGSGKTTTVKSIAEGFRAQGRVVAMCAPTGKAARRLEEATDNEFAAQTIHRLLGYGQTGVVATGTAAVAGTKHFGWDSEKSANKVIRSMAFAHHRDHPITADLLVMDEASMADVELCSFLFDAIPDECCVVIVGDPNQLPPVGPGAVLRDALAYELAPVARLGQCHRQAGPLRQNAAAVLAGEVPQTVEWDAAKGGPGPWYVARGCHAPEAVVSYVGRLFTDIVPKHLGYDRVREVQFLTAKHEGNLGTKAVNRMLQAIHQRSLGVQVEGGEGESKRPRLYVGDKVIQTKNNYDLELMNGHQGIVVEPSPRLTVDFDGRVVMIPKDCVGDIELAYCLTPHKVQGSEFPCVVTLCHKSHAFMQHRNWLYTSVTRAKRTSIIVGDHDGISRAAEKVVNDRRRTLLPLFAKADAFAARG